MPISALLFLMVFFGGLGAAIFFHGWAAFIVYQLVYFFNPDNRWWSAHIPELRYSLFSVLLMMGVLAIHYKKYSATSPWTKQPVLKWMAALLLMYYIAYSFALVELQHDKFTFEFTKLVIIIFVAYKLINTEKALDMCIWGYLIGASYIGYVATSTGRNSGARLEGIGMVDSPDANGTAAALVPSAVLLMYSAWQGSYKIKIFAVVAGALIANGLVLINSRGAFLGAAVSLAVFMFFMIFSPYQKKGQRAAGIFMMIFGLIGAYSMTDDLFWERMSTLKHVSDEEKQAEAGTSRTVFWFVTFDMLKDHPLGMGIYGYNILAPLYMDDETRGGVKYRSVHSTWFQGLSEVGYIGFGIFCMMIYSVLKLTRKAKKLMIEKGNFNIYFKILALECSLFGYLIAATFVDRFRAEILYWMILFLALAAKFYYLNLQKPPDIKLPRPIKKLLTNGVREIG